MHANTVDPSRRTKRRLAHVLLGGAALALGSAAAAQAGPPTAPAATVPAASVDAGLEDIVVTAQKRREALQDTPISISAVTAAGLEARGVRSIGDIAGIVPNLAVNSGPQGSSDANFSIRGVGQFDFIITSDPGVGVYLDGVYLGRTVGALLDSGDIERIEVLRGPQGTLFGRNTLGGAVSVVSKEPSTEALSGDLRLTGGSRDRIDAEAGFNVPLGDDLAARVYGFTRNQDGQSRRDSDGARFGSIERLGINGALAFTPGEVFKLTVRGDYSRDRGTPQPVFRAGGVPLPFFPADFLDEVPSGFYRTTQSNDAEQRNDIWGVSATAELDLGFTTLRSITAYRELEGFSTFDADGSSYRLYDQPSSIDQHQFSQELQTVGDAFDEKLKYVGGLYYFTETARQVQELCFAPLLLPPGASSLPPGAFNRGDPCPYWFQDNDQTTRAYAVFGQVSYSFSDQFELTLGGRYSWENKRILTTQNFRLPDDTVIVPLVTGLRDRVSFRKFTPRANLNFRPTNDLLLYASYSKGFRSGGFNGRIAVPGLSRVPAFGADTNDTYEIGVKSELFDRRLRANLTAFYSTYKGTQQTVIDPVALFRIANAGNARIWGFEAELTAVPTRGLNLTAAIGYNNSRLTSIDPNLIGTSVGNELPFNPEVSLSGSVEYVFDLPSGGAITPRVDARYQSRVYFETNNSPLSSQRGYETIDARLTWELPGKRFSIAAFGRNLTDSQYYTFGQDALAVQGVAFLLVGKPREFGATAAYKF